MLGSLTGDSFGPFFGDTKRFSIFKNLFVKGGAGVGVGFFGHIAPKILKARI